MSKKDILIHEYSFDEGFKMGLRHAVSLVTSHNPSFLNYINKDKIVDVILSYIELNEARENRNK